MHLLVTEDDLMLGRSLCDVLRREAYTVDWATDGEAAQDILAHGAIDLVVLDLGLPKVDGMTLLHWLRARGDATPVLILTARDQVADRVEGLDGGADDYLVKPFDLHELLARLRVMGRRRTGRADPRIRHLGIVLDPVSREVSYNDAPVPLTRREYALLLALLEQPGRVWTREELAGRLYADGVELHSNAIEVHVHALRRKLAPALIQSARGVGYLVARADA
jgi:two-component system response regulator QseB